MTIIDRLREFLFPEETRARAVPPGPVGEPLQLVRDFWGDWPEMAGDHVTPATAIRNPTVLACVRVLSESIASLPLKVYNRASTGKTPAENHPLYEVLHGQANSEMTSLELIETMMVHVLLWGNAYCEIELNQRSDVLGLWPLRPDRTFPQRINGDLWFFTRDADNNLIRLPASRVWRFGGLSSNGVVGMSPVALAREAIGLSNAGETSASRYFTSGARPGGVLKHPGKLSPTALDNLRRSWNEEHQGLSRGSRVAILEEGMSWEDTGMPWKDAQFLETRQFQVEEIARMFRVPLHMVGELTHATFSNIEHQGIEFVVHTLRPWLVRIEQSIRRDLIGPLERQRISAEFLVDGLLRGDTNSRYAAYAIGRQWGWLSPNDVRRLENLNDIEGGDEYLTPLNMQVLGEEPPEPAPASAPMPMPEQDQPDGEDMPDQPDPMADRAIQIFVRDACDRIGARAGDRAAKHRPWIEGVLRPIMAAAGVDIPDAQARALALRWQAGELTVDTLNQRLLSLFQMGL